MSDRALIFLALIFALAAGPAAADPLTVGLTSSLATALGISEVLASALIRVGVGLLLSAAVNGLTKKSSVLDLRELAIPTSLPPYRFIYGRFRAYGSPAPWRVKDSILYGCLIFNSRPSDGDFTIYIDRRPVELTGDLYDFATGATATNDPFAGYAKFWVGLGDQTAPPAQILSEAGDIFDATDGWTGLTVLWVRLDRGPNESRAERWPVSPPEMEMEGNWSKVWDPRDGAQDGDDPDTWVWSANQALCVLDALRQNPVERYLDANLWLETFEWGADVADELVDKAGGGTIPRYECNGLVRFDGREIEDVVQPMMLAGAASWTRSGGRLGFIPGAYRAPILTISDAMDDAPIRFGNMKRGQDLPNVVRATYLSPARGYEQAEAPYYEIPGADADGGAERALQLDFTMATDFRQVERVMKIMGYRARAQKTLAFTAPPAAFEAVAGSVVEVDFASPFQRRNGEYEVQSLHPAFDLVGESGVALRCPIALRELDPIWFDWDAETEEQPEQVGVFDADFQPASSDVDPPDPVSATAAAGEIEVIFDAPNDGDYSGMEIFVNSVDDSATATLLFGPIYTAPNATISQTQTGLASAQTRYYFARSVDRFYFRSDFSASISATTP